MSKKNIFIQDDDSHWYYIKTEKKKLFNDLKEQAYETENFDKFLDEFEHNQIGCHPSNFHDSYNEDGSKKTRT